ncbi:MAG: hypothetical protein LC768_01590 [Acidobacteria bacterium]|nr:hypothetical protein [Acidobacteriota bacterium]MCA1637024.1 hypothetical protein [Acidobacteriota bacterium]
MIENRVLLVEGTDDLHVLAHIFKSHGFEGKIFIRDQEGVENVKKGLDENFFDNLLEDLPVELKGSEVIALGIVVDADFNLNARWRSFANKLKDLKYEDVPDLPEPNGTILTHSEDLPKIGVWLMPNNTLPGMLEDFVKLLVPDEQKELLQRANEAVDAIPKEERLFVTENSDETSKAQIYTYLAWQERPGVPYGVAIREKFLKADSPHTLNLMTWIKELFNL